MEASSPTVPRYKVADEVCVKIRDNAALSSLARIYDSMVTLEVVSLYEGGYFLFVPSRLCLVGAVRVDKSSARRFGIPDNYIGDNVIFLSEDHIVKLYNRREGMRCSKCKEFYHLAEPNQPDGTLRCYACRQNPYR